MNFMKVVKAMKEGKKVKRPCFSEGSYHYMNEHEYVDGKYLAIFHSGNELVSQRLIDMEATDWEIIKDRMTLSDRIDGADLDVDDVKKSVKELIDYWCDIGGIIQPDRIKEKAKEIFGERLIE